jgi:hypothetical protein
MEQQSYPFENIRIFNRLDMEIEIDICSVYIEDDLVVVVRANDRHHRSTVEKNIEHIAFQLKERFAPDKAELSIVEYVDRHSKLGQSPEWRQWRFKWVGSSPMNASHHLLASFKLSTLHLALLNDQQYLECAI